jgi:hypothetical protein
MSPNSPTPPVFPLLRSLPLSFLLSLSPSFLYKYQTIFMSISSSSCIVNDRPEENDTFVLYLSI